ncbi:phosphopantetheine-binding protein [Kitasatospora saccharophila]
MPLTPNQKIDRAALADLATPSGGGATGRRRAPGTALEATVAAVFAEVLGVESVSVDDDFFAMGGHSLLATRLWSRLRSVLDTEFALRQVLDTPTAAGLAAALEQRTEAAAPRPRLVRKP